MVRWLRARSGNAHSDSPLREMNEPTRALLPGSFQTWTCPQLGQSAANCNEFMSPHRWSQSLQAEGLSTGPPAVTRRARLVAVAAQNAETEDADSSTLQPVDTIPPQPPSTA
ncbi:hypothetical protein Q8A73_015709 [Channa argus]|nr:hypothetical protein Q8A73_015709 [Channa argus]